MFLNLTLASEHTSSIIASGILNPALAYLPYVKCRLLPEGLSIHGAEYRRLAQNFARPANTLAICTLYLLFRIIPRYCNELVLDGPVRYDKVMRLSALAINKLAHQMQSTKCGSRRVEAAVPVTCVTNSGNVACACSLESPILAVRRRSPTMNPSLRITPRSSCYCRKTIGSGRRKVYRQGT
jgi:hypothetical protein